MMNTSLTGSNRLCDKIHIKAGKKKAFSVLVRRDAFVAFHEQSVPDGRYHGYLSLRIHNSEGMGTGHIAGAEYLPYGADPSRFLYHDPIGTGDVSVSGYERHPLGAEAYIVNRGAQTGEVRFSLLCYKGYHARNADNGEELNCRAGENFEVTADIPGGFQGKVQIRFESPWYWRAGEIVTLLTALCMAAGAGLRRHSFWEPPGF